MTEKELRKKVVKVAEDWRGLNEKDGSHKEILDVYNGHKPLARGYKVQPKDAWCATYVSAVFIKAGLTKAAPTECSCSRMIELYKALGRWEEYDGYIPEPGDIVMYDWQDNGKGDNKGAPDHVGLVVSVNGSKLTIIEGNIKDAVGYRDLTIGGKYIRGYCLPNYAASVKVTPSLPKVEPAMEFSKSLAKTYTVTASGLNLRRGAATTKAVIKVLPRGTKVTNYGYYTQKGDTLWLLVKAADGTVGYCAKKYLQ